MPKKKPLRCPVCGQRIIDADERTQTTLLTSEDIDAGKSVDYFSKCPKCKKEIGIKKVS